MKIVERNSERLVLKRGPSLAGLLFAVILAGGLLVSTSGVAEENSRAVAAVAVVTGLVMVLFAMSRAQKLTLDRRTDELHFRSWSMLGPRTLRMPLGGLAGATLQVKPGSSGADMRPALMLKTPKGPKEYPLYRQNIGQSRSDRLIETINGWLAEG